VPEKVVQMCQKYLPPKTKKGRKRPGPALYTPFTHAFMYDAALGIDFRGDDAEVAEESVSKTDL
jgi:hypothetical protein